jgi:carbonic anhydrase/acetyltransferase-like protein (isoleucine patch superfamily)
MSFDAFYGGIRGTAPSLWAEITGAPDPAKREYVLAQVAGLYCGASLLPLECFEEVPALDGVANRCPGARLFVAGEPRAEKVTISGIGSGALWLSPEATVSGMTLGINGTDAALVIGPAARVTNMQCAFHHARTKWVQGCGATIEWGGNLLLQEDERCIAIGDDAMVSTYVYMRTSDSHGVYDRATGKRVNQARSVVVHQHAWIGRAALLNRGTEVGKDAVVGQGAVTSGKLAGGAIHAGAPATTWRENVTWDRSLAGTIDEAEAQRATARHYQAMRKARERLLDMRHRPPPDRLSALSRALSDPGAPVEADDAALGDIPKLCNAAAR